MAVRWLGTAGLAFLAGVVYYAMLLSWSVYFGAVAIVPFSIACALVLGRGRRAHRMVAAHRVANPWVTAAVWVCADALIVALALRRLLLG